MDLGGAQRCAKLCLVGRPGGAAARRTAELTGRSLVRGIAMAIPYTVRLAISQSSSGFRVELFTEDLGDTIGQTLPLDVWETAKVGGVPIAEWLAFLQRNAP